MLKLLMSTFPDKQPLRYYDSAEKKPLTDPSHKTTVSSTLRRTQQLLNNIIFGALFFFFFFSVRLKN